MKLLLDTSIVIDYLRRKDKKDSLLLTLIANGYTLSISIITHAELYSGKSVWKSKKLYNQLEDLLRGITILPLNNTISRNAGKIRAQHNTTLMDAIIAATTIYYNHKLVSLNLKDFQKISNLELFNIQN